ncbi:TylF/MycF/NovP-related O-methyltransferase [Robbsia andropogonis]|uniref:TylF/MycF/NovP-related O-methyltransferase n=1 Tax=Robbsia andropogonis TaxID=28092 RepID=UPI002A6A15EF|nr:TylF/MycF/NovP-related O-methyltransferase [Robbsia andropogonis]
MNIESPQAVPANASWPLAESPLTVSAQGASTSLRAVGSECGVHSVAHAYLDIVKRYVSGALDARTSGISPCAALPSGVCFHGPITESDCIARLADADRVFAPWLSAAGKTAAEVAGFPPAKIAVSLNHMHHESRCLTMSEGALLDNVIELAEDVIARRIPGDFIETGVWRGGMTILMRAALAAFRDPARRVWVADSFAGLPSPDPAVHLRDAVWNHVMGLAKCLESDIDAVRAAFARAGLLDDRVCFLKGWFNETLPNAPTGPLALMRLDGDWHDSTRDALEALYPRLSPGGAVIIDDYGLPTGCAQAVDLFRRQHRITAPLIRVNRQAVYWRKPLPIADASSQTGACPLRPEKG